MSFNIRQTLYNAVTVSCGANAPAHNFQFTNYMSTRQQAGHILVRNVLVFLNHILNINLKKSKLQTLVLLTLTQMLKNTTFSFNIFSCLFSSIFVVVRFSYSLTMDKMFYSKSASFSSRTVPFTNSSLTLFVNNFAISKLSSK